jgi:hypothetical protein
VSGEPGGSIDLVCAKRWRLVGHEDLAGRLRRTPAGYQLLEFRPYTWIDTDGNSRAGVVASDGGGTSAVAEVDDDRMMFAPWINDLSGRPGLRPSSALDAARGPAGLQEQKFTCRVLSGEVWWSVTEEALSFSRPEVGSLEFVAELAARI